MDEMVDVVDDQDEVIGTLPRRLIRAQKKPHRACYLLCVNTAGRILVEVRTLCKDYAPGMLDACVGGIIDSGEAPDAAARRELFEEVGIDATAPQNLFMPMGKVKLPIFRVQSFLYAYLYLVRSDAVTLRQQSEVSGVMYLTPEELIELKECCVSDSFEAFRIILDMAAEAGLVSMNLCSARISERMPKQANRHFQPS